MRDLFGGTRKLVRKLLSDQRGNIVVTFALLIVPVMGFVGAAVDYSRGNRVKAAMQAAADSTVLMLAKTIAAGGSSSMSAAQINQKANDFFTALIQNLEVKNLKVDAVYTTDTNSKVVVTAQGTVKADFMPLMGIQNLAVRVFSESLWGGASKMQVALVLDNTGSMYEYGKIFSLKTATNALLDQLSAAAANPNDVNVAIIPFAKTVNVGPTTSNINAPWIDWSDWDSENGHEGSTQTCTTTVNKKGKSTKKCANSTTWIPDSHNTWNGCIADRDQDYDVKNTAPNPADKSLPPTSASTLFPADQDDLCPVAMLPLTNNWTTLKAKVAEMVPTGYTNQPIGLVWGWHALSTGLPMNAPGKGPDVQQIIILLTDGLNTMDRWYDNQGPIDARQKILCDNIKAAGITLYTIQVNTGGADPVSTVLQNCASKPEYFFHLTTANAIVTAFNTIGTNLSKLRIAK